MRRGNCSVSAFSFDGRDRPRQAIDFDPSVPVPDPDVTVSPQFGLPDRAVVNVHARGFSPGERVVVSQCIAARPTYGVSCGLTAGGDILTAAGRRQGEVDTSLRVHRT